jgi:CheY-like chemotaxis protein
MKGRLIMARVLVVDDEPLISMVVQEWLTELGCETIGPTESVRSALDLIGTATVDGAILDVSLNCEDSYPVADVLRELGVPIAFATGHGVHGIDSRFNDALILSKPFDFEAVKGFVAKLVP